jgi:hypothetical protein
MKLTQLKHHQLEIGLALLTFIFFLVLTAHQPLGVSLDSVSYLEIAQDLVSKNQLVNHTGQLPTHRPPGYPLLISLTSQLFALKLITTVRYLAAVFLAGSLIVFNLLLQKLKINIKFRLALTIILILSPAFSVFLMAWTEGPFIFFLLLATQIFFTWLQSRQPVHLIITGLSMTILLSLRYAAVNFLAVITFYLLVIDSKPQLKTKLKNSLIFLANASIFPLIWFTLSQISNVNPTNRALQLHLITKNHWYRFITTIAHWFIPYELAQHLIHQLSLHLTAPNFSQMIFLITVAASLIYLKIFQQHLAPRLSSKVRQQTLFLLISIGSYLLFLISSISLFDLATPLNNRILAPIYPFALILISLILCNNQHRLKPILMVVWLTLMFWPYATDFRQRLTQFHQSGLKYTSKHWQQSELITTVAARAKGKTIYSNGADLLRLYLNIDQKEHYQIKPFPRRFNLYTGENTTKSKTQMKQVITATHQDQAVIIYFHEMRGRNYFGSLQQLNSWFDPDQISSYQQGIMIE